MQTLDKHIVKAMLPDGDIISLDLNEPLDGDQILQFHYVSLLAAIKQFIADPAYANKLYTQFEYEFSMERPYKRMFRRVNSGMVFEYFQLQHPAASPVVFVLASDASYSGQHREHHPVYCKYPSQLKFAQ